MLASLRGKAHQSFESITQPAPPGQRTGRQPEAYYRVVGQDLQDGGVSLHNQTIVQSYNDFKGVLHPTDPSLSPNRISLHGLGMQEGDPSLQSSHRLEAQQNPAGKKTGRNQQLQIQLKSLYNQKYQDEVTMEGGTGVAAQAAAGTRQQQPAGRQHTQRRQPGKHDITAEPGNITLSAGTSSGAFEGLGTHQVHILGPQGQPGAVGLTLAPGSGAATGDIAATSMLGGGATITNNLYLNLNTNYIKTVN